MTSAKTNADIKELCKILRLNGIAKSFETMEQEAADYEDFLYRILSQELQEAEERMKQSRIRRAHFPYKKYLEDLELDCLPKDMRKRLPELAGLDFIRNGQNLILTGNPGTGKTHVAIGLGIRACEQGFRVLFTTVPYLVTELKENVNAKTLKAFEKRFEKYDLVIADEMGYVSFDREGADLLFTNLSLRATQKSTIITSNLTFERWDEIFGDAAITSAIVDRLTYKAILVDMEGDSYRFRETLRANGASFERLMEGNLTEMNATKSERADVWYWVHHGVDIYDNPWFYYNEAGWPADLVTAIRMDNDRLEEYEAMTEEERLELSRDHSEEARVFEQSLWELEALPRPADLVLDGHLT